MIDIDADKALRAIMEALGLLDDAREGWGVWAQYAALGEW